MTPAQQKKAIKFIKDEVTLMDKSNPDCTGFCNDKDVMEKRVFLIQVGALPDRRKKK